MCYNVISFILFYLKHFDLKCWLQPIKLNPYPTNGLHSPVGIRDQEKLHIALDALAVPVTNLESSESGCVFTSASASGFTTTEK